MGKSVAVIGAGMAGLAAAGALAQAGADVTIYEARGRIGGRVWTSDLWPDLPCDLGASWIHGVRGNPITKLARAAGAQTTPTDYDSAAAFLGGVATQQPEPWGILETAQDLADTANGTLSLQQAIESLDDYRARGGKDKSALRAAIHRAIEHEYGGDWGQLSAHWYDQGRDYGGGDVLFAGGYGQIARHAAKGLRIQTQAVLQQIAPRAGGVDLTFASGQTLRADAAVLTLPLGVLKSGHIHFGAPLAPARQAAIDGLGMGLLNKVFLRFDTVPQVPAVDWLEKLDTPALEFPEWVNLAHVLDAPALLGFNAGDSADQIEGWSDADTAAAATDALRAMFGSAFPAPAVAQITRWRRDVFAQGSYSFHAAGAAKTARADLFGADWDGRIAFAGEACSSDHPSTVHGAWTSGLKAATELAL